RLAERGQPFDRASVMRAGFGAGAAAGKRPREIVMDLEAVHADFGQLAKTIRAAGVVLLTEPDHAFAHQAVERLVFVDLVFRIGAGGLAGRRTARTHVTESAQFL